MVEKVEMLFDIGCMRFLAAGLLVAAVLAVVACGDDSTPVSQPTDTPVPPPTATVPLALTTAVVPARAPANTLEPTATPVRTQLPTPPPTNTPLPLSTPNPMATPEPFPTATAAPRPTATLAPEPTAPEPTSNVTPQPTATPEPVSEEPEAPVGISGQEVMAMLTEEETGCIKEKFGEDLYNRIVELRITSRLANDTTSRFLFECITQESINRVGLALIRAEADLSEETSACILEALTDTPQAMDLRLGRLPDDIDVDAVHLLESGAATIECLNNDEALSIFSRMNMVLDQRSPLRGRDILAMLSSSELTCVKNSVEGSTLEEIEDITVVESFQAAPHLFGCIEPTSLSTIFVEVSDSRLGGLSDETRKCSESVLRTAIQADPRPHLIEFLFGVTDDRPEQYDEAIALSRHVFACIDDDELLEVQKAIADSLHRE